MPLRFGYPVVNKMSTNLILMPGFDGTGELFAPLQTALGTGLDSTTIVRYTTERCFDDHVNTAAQSVRGDCVLIAESFSGPVAIALMAGFPSRIRCAVLCATFAVCPLRSLARMIARAPAALFGMNAFRGSLLRSLCLNGSDDSVLLRQAISVAGSLSAVTIRNRMRVLADVDVRPLLSQIVAPVLYLRATDDRIIPASYSREVMRGLRNIRAKDIEGPHLLLQARPRECAAAITSFVSELQIAPQHALRF